MDRPVEKAPLQQLGLDALAEVLDHLPDACTLSRAVRGPDGHARDMRLLWMNRQALGRHPRLRVLLVSGFAPGFGITNLPPRVAFMAKPFTGRDLAVRLRNLLRSAPVG